MKHALSILTLCILMTSFTTAYADYQTDFELTCDYRTLYHATVYNTDGDDRAAIDRISSGTYVYILDRGAEEWVKIIYMIDGIQYHGWIEAELEKCVTYILDASGRMYPVHELDPDYPVLIRFADDTIVYDDNSAE